MNQIWESSELLFNMNQSQSEFVISIYWKQIC